MSACILLNLKQLRKMISCAALPNILTFFRNKLSNLIEI